MSLLKIFPSVRGKVFLEEKMWKYLKYIVYSVCCINLAAIWPIPSVKKTGRLWIHHISEHKGKEVKFEILTGVEGIT